MVPLAPFKDTRRHDRVSRLSARGTFLSGQGVGDGGFWDGDGRGHTWVHVASRFSRCPDMTMVANRKPARAR